MMNIMNNSLKERKMRVVSQDSSLGSSAIGLLFKLIDTDTNDFSVKTAMSLVNDKESKVKATLKELEEKGYIIRNRNRIRGRFSCYSYVLLISLSDEKCEDLFLQSLEPKTETPCGENTTRSKTTLVNSHLDKITTEETHHVKNFDMVQMPENTGFESHCVDKSYAGYTCSTSISNYDMIDISNNNIYNYDISNLSNPITDTITAISTSTGTSVVTKDREAIKAQLGYDTLISNFKEDKDMIDMIINIISESFVSRSNYGRISGRSVHISEIRKQFSKLGQADIEYVINCIKTSAKKIRSIKPYLITSLYNAAVNQDNRKMINRYNKRDRNSFDQRKDTNYGTHLRNNDDLYTNKLNGFVVG